jgi:acetyltransferase-like isoleucine patch superfamily enzyme
LVQALLYRPLHGERSQGRWLPHTRISPASHLQHEDRLHLADHVYIGPFCWLEASGGITLGEGVQITSHVCIVTHSSHRTQRLMGRAYATPQLQRPGWVAGPVEIGPYCFIGPHAVIEPGTRLGRGCIVRAGSVVRGHFGDHAVLDGRPARVVADARVRDEALLSSHPGWRAAYDAWALINPAPTADAGAPAAAPLAVSPERATETPPRP